jgi:RNA polymerase sigma-32 factor
MLPDGARGVQDLRVSFRPARRMSGAPVAKLPDMNSDHDIRRLGRTPPLTPEEELRLTTEYFRTRDRALARRIAEANLRLVIKLAAASARRSRLSLADLIQEGTVGLMEAVERFDPARGVRFASYATWWIRAYLLKSMLDGARIVRAGRSRDDRRAFFNGQAPPPEVALDAPAPGGDHRTLGERLPDVAHRPVDEQLELVELAAVVRRNAEAFRARLPAREAVVFGERVLAEEGASLRRLATRFSVSSERIRQIEQDLLDDFRPRAEAA